MPRSARALVGALTLAIGTVLAAPGLAGAAGASSRYGAVPGGVVTARVSPAGTVASRPHLVVTTMPVVSGGRRVDLPVTRVAGAGAAATSTAPDGVAPSGATASGTVPSFTWTGADATASTPNDNWSDGANWQGGAAPASGSTVDLVFPALSCTRSIVGCGASNNDLASLDVANLSITDSAASNAGGYSLSGNGISLGGLSVSTTGSGSTNPFLAYLDLPVTLTGPEAWTVDGGGVQAGLYLAASVSGPGSLTISESGSADINIATSVGVASLGISGADSADVGSASVSNGATFLASGTSLSFPSGGSMQVADIGLGSVGAPAFGPLSVSGAYLFDGNGTSPEGTTAISGTLTVDQSSVLSADGLSAGSGTPVAGTDYPQVTASGGVALNGITLVLQADCNLADGTAFTLVSAASLNGEVASNGATVPDGGVVASGPDQSPSCGTSGASAPYFQITYDDAAGTLVATVVPQPTSATSLSSSPASPVVGQPTTLTATVSDSPTAVVPSGTVEFTNGANPIAGCTNVPLSGTSPYTAECAASFANAGVHDLGAAFTPTPGATETPSSAASTLAVQAAQTSTGIGASTTTPSVGQSVTLTATVAAVAPGGGTPGGDVAFSLDGSPIAACSSEPLGGGSPDTATCQTSFAAGSHTVTAAYLGTSDYSASTSAGLPINAAASYSSSTSLTASVPDPVVGEADTLTATVSPSSGGPAPAGTVAFSTPSGTIAGCSAVVLSASAPYEATCPTSFSVAGSLSIGASFTSSVAEVASSNGVLSLSVAKAASAVSLSASSYKVLQGNDDTFTAHVSVLSPGSTPVGGDVAFLENGTTVAGCGSVAVRSGSASCRTRMVVLGTSSVVARYLGTATLAGSTSPVRRVDVVARPGYFLVTSAGGVYAYDGAKGHGSMLHKRLPAPVVGMGVTLEGGYYLATSKGNVYGFDAKVHGSLAGKRLPAPIVGIAVTPGGGYYLAGAKGNVYGFNGATVHGSLAGRRFKGSVVAITLSPHGGYYLATSAGAVYGFDGARTHGSMAGKRLPAPVVGMGVTRGGGYYLVTSKGNVYGFDAKVHGSLAGKKLPAPVVGITVTAWGGYYLATSKGNVYGFDAKVHGSLAGKHFAGSVVGISVA